MNSHKGMLQQLIIKTSFSNFWQIAIVRSLSLPPTIIPFSNQTQICPIEMANVQAVMMMLFGRM